MRTQTLKMPSTVASRLEPAATQKTQLSGALSYPLKDYLYIRDS